MVYVPQPYVTTGNNNQQQQPHSPTRQPTNAYGAPSGYAPAPAMGGGYNPTTTYSVPTTTSGYAPAPAGGYNSNMNYSAPAPTPTYAPAPAGGYGGTTPDFSQALNYPPPTNNPAPAGVYGAPTTYDRSPTYSTAYGGATSGTPTYSPAVVVPVGNTTGGYQGGYRSGDGPSAVGGSGPTGGLISEGNPTTCHKVDYEIKGHEMQLVEIELDPSESVIAEAGALMFMEEGIKFETKFGDGSAPKEGFFKKLTNAGGRLLMGESLFVTHFSNAGNNKARVAFAAPFPGTILPLNLQNLGGKIICEKDAFLCAAMGTKLSVHLNKKLGSGLAGGEGFILQKLEGDGMVFIHAGGTVIKRELRGEMLRVDTGCVVAFTDGINFDIQSVPGLKSMAFGGEGMFLATLQGTGTVWIQSLPFSRLAVRVLQSAPSGALPFGGGGR